MSHQILNESLYTSDVDHEFSYYQISNQNSMANDMDKLSIDSLATEILSWNESLSDLNQNLNLTLDDWQLSQLENVQENESGVRCLLRSWLVTQKYLQKGSYCNATWDNVYCWPPTPLGTTVNRSCLDAFQETEPFYAQHLQGHGYRVCLQNGSWLWDNWTNYTECADSLDDFLNRTTNYVGANEVVTTVQYILFIGSILSILFILSAVLIFYCFRSLWCDRVQIHINLMTALVLRYMTLLIITEPHIFNHSTNYRSNDKVCKGLLIVYLYATLCSINWMFIEGVYINGKLTTNVFNAKAPFKVYYTIGWLFPLVLMTTWATIMSFKHDGHCWSGYSAMSEIWIIICPIVLALTINFMFLINIIRVMLTKVRTTQPKTDVMQFRKAAKATILLFPLLGINNFLVLYNPGGDLYKYFVVINTFLSSTQGIFVAVGYCYLSSDVRAAFKRVYRRFLARNANSIRRREIRGNANCSGPFSVTVQQLACSHNNKHTDKNTTRVPFPLNECSNSSANKQSPTHGTMQPSNGPSSGESPVHPGFNGEGYAEATNFSSRTSSKTSYV